MTNALVKTGTPDGDIKWLREEIRRYLVAREAAERAFSTLKYGHPTEYRDEVTIRWKEMCEKRGMSVDGDFGDWTC